MTYNSLTWVRKGPGAIDVANVRRDADNEDTVEECYQAAVPLISTVTIQETQQGVERDPADQADGHL